MSVAASIVPGMALGDVGTAQVVAAVEEFDRIGRDAFLTKYGFKPSRTYLLVVDGRRYDSKAVVGAAHGCLPGREPLAASEFSGGRDHAVKLLVGLGFEVIPAGGEALSSSRLVTQIESLRVGHTPAGPRLHQPITLLWALGRAVRGEPRILPWSETEAALSGLLASHGRPGDRPRAEPDPVTLAAQYQRLCVRVEEQAGSGGRRRDELRRAPVRSGAARQAVLLRSRGLCENPECAGQPEDVTTQGDPILEVDHVIEITQDGPDHPSHMVALCPNCHAVKTRGRTGPALKAALLVVARELHDRASWGT